MPSSITTCWSPLWSSIDSQRAQPELEVLASLAWGIHGDAVALGISIYPSQKAAYTETIENGGIAWTSHKENALFVGRPVESPGTRVYEVPALPPGRYYMTYDSIPGMLNAWLIVQ